MQSIAMKLAQFCTQVMLDVRIECLSLAAMLALNLMMKRYHEVPPTQPMPSCRTLQGSTRLSLAAFVSGPSGAPVSVRCPLTVIDLLACLFATIVFNKRNNFESLNQEVDRCPLSRQCCRVSRRCLSSTTQALVCI